MAWGTSLAVTINSIAYTLNRINNDNFGSDWVFRDASQTLSMKIKHSTDAPVKTTGVVNLRHTVTFTQRVYSTSTTKEFIRTIVYTIVTADYDDPAVALLTVSGVISAIASSTHNTDLLAGTN